MHCMQACVGELICTAFLDTSLKLLIIKKPLTTGKLNQWWKQRRLSTQYVYDIELHFTEKEKRTQTRKLKRFLSKSKDVGL